MLKRLLVLVLAGLALSSCRVHEVEDPCPVWQMCIHHSRTY